MSFIGFLHIHKLVLKGMTQVYFHHFLSETQTMQRTISLGNVDNKCIFVYILAK